MFANTSTVLQQDWRNGQTIVFQTPAGLEIETLTGANHELATSSGALFKSNLNQISLEFTETTTTVTNLTGRTIPIGVTLFLAIALASAATEQAAVNNVISFQTLSNYAITPENNGFNLIYNGTAAGLWTIPSGVALGNNFGVYIENRSVNREPMRITPASGTINGLSSFTIPLGSGIYLNSTGSSDFVASRVPAVNGRITLAKSNIPMLIPPSGSVNATGGANATVTLGTALNETLAEGCYMLLPADGAFAGSPSGWYYTVFSSTTVGIIYNNIWTEANLNAPVIPDAPSSITSGRGATAYNIVLNSQHTMCRHLIAGNTIGRDGMVECKFVVTHSNNAGRGKDFIVDYGGYTFYQNAPEGGNFFSARVGFANQNNVARQKALHGDFGAGGYFNGTINLTKGTANSAIDLQLNIRVRKRTAGENDYLILQSYLIELVQ